MLTAKTVETVLRVFLKSFRSRYRDSTTMMRKPLYVVHNGQSRMELIHQLTKAVQMTKDDG